MKQKLDIYWNALVDQDRADYIINDLLEIHHNLYGTNAAVNAIRETGKYEGSANKISVSCRNENDPLTLTTPAETTEYNNAAVTFISNAFPHCSTISHMVGAVAEYMANQEGKTIFGFCNLYNQSLSKDQD